MHSLNGYRFRGQVAVVSAALVFVIGLRLAQAVDTDKRTASPQSTRTKKTPAHSTGKPATGTDKPAVEQPAANGTDEPAAEQPASNSTDKPVAEQAPVEASAGPPAPSLQLQDEGPSARDSDSDRLARFRMATANDMDERPFWKHWIFWAATGALVAGAVSMAIYAASGTDSSLAPCPPDVVVSLGCFGAGR